MRLISTLLLIVAASFCITAQVTDRSFISKEEFTYLSKNIDILETQIAQAKIDIEKKDLQASSTADQRIRNVLSQIDQNCELYIERISFYRNKINDDTYLDGNLGKYQYKKFKQAGHLYELTYDAEMFKKIESFSKQIKDQSQALENSNGHYHPRYENAKNNLDSAIALLENAKSLNQLINNNIISQ